MARTPAPPGPPPPHYRPIGSSRPPLGTTPLPGTRPDAGTTPGSPPRDGIGPGAATAVAVVTLLLGMVVGFFLGRSYESTDAPAAAPATTTTTTQPAPAPPGDTIPLTPNTSAPPGTELAPSTIGGLDDPIPAGQAYVLGLYELELLETDRDAESALRAFDPGNPPAPPGEVHVLVRLAVRFTDATGLGNPATIPFFVTDGSTEWYGFESSCGRIPDELASYGFIEQGEEAVGTVCFTVPDDAVDDLVFGTEGFAGPVHFALPG